MSDSVQKFYQDQEEIINKSKYSSEVINILELFKKLEIEEKYSVIKLLKEETYL